MKNDKTKFLLCVLFFVVLAAITFRCAWGADMIFSASDMNIGRLAFSKNYHPEALVGYFTANELFGNSGHGIKLIKVLISIMPIEVFANVFYGIVLVLSSLSMVWFLRIWKRSWLASVLGALIGFWVNSVMLSAGGHGLKMEVLAFSTLCICFVEKAVRSASAKKSMGFSLLAGLCVGIMMTEQQDVALLAGLFVGPYAIFRLIQAHKKTVSRWLGLLLPLATVSLLLSGNTILRSYEENIAKATSMQGEDEDRWNFVTQWSMVPSEWPDLVASGWSGWGSNNLDGPYWGKIGQSAEWEKTKQGFRNFKITSIYFGIIPFLLGSFGLVVAVRNLKSEEGAQILFWSVAGLLGFWLAFGKYSLLYKLFYQLPLVSNIRAPMKFMDNFQICLGIVSAYGLDCLIAGSRGRGARSAGGSTSTASMLKVFWIASAVIGALMLIAGLKVLVFPGDWKNEFVRMGFGVYVDNMLNNMSNAWFHAALLACSAAGLAFMVWRGIGKAKWVAIAFVVVLAADSLLLTSHYFKATSIASLKEGNVLINYLKENQGSERTYFVDQGGIYNQWLASDGPYHGLNLFNIWQMPRMPLEYKEFLGTVGRNQLRLWELASIKYVAAPAEIVRQLQQNPDLAKQFKPVLNYQVPTAQGVRNDVLLEFKRVVPRFSLFHGWESMPLEEQCKVLASSGHNPHAVLLLAPGSRLGSRVGSAEFQPLDAEVTKCKARMVIQTQTEAVVRFSQYFQSGWRVFVDGEPAELLRVDYLCMGVAVPQGEHIVEFRCVDGVPDAIFILAVFVVSVVAATWLLLSDRRLAA